MERSRVVCPERRVFNQLKIGKWNGHGHRVSSRLAATVRSSLDEDNFIRRRSLASQPRERVPGNSAAPLRQLPKIIYARCTELAAAINKNNGRAHQDDTFGDIFSLADFIREFVRKHAAPRYLSNPVQVGVTVDKRPFDDTLVQPSFQIRYRRLAKNMRLIFRSFFPSKLRNAILDRVENFVSNFIDGNAISLFQNFRERLINSRVYNKVARRYSKNLIICFRHTAKKCESNNRIFFLLCHIK